MRRYARRLNEWNPGELCRWTVSHAYYDWSIASSSNAVGAGNCSAGVAARNALNAAPNANSTLSVVCMFTLLKEAWHRIPLYERIYTQSRGAFSAMKILGEMFPSVIQDGIHL